MKLAAYILGICLAVGTANASTVDEITFGEFSGDATNPSVIAPGTSLVLGTGDSNVYDIFEFTGLASGAQDIVFDFSAPSNASFLYAGGGTIVYSETPFAYNWDGTYAGTFGVYGSAGNDQFTLSLDSDFGGTLYLGLYFTFGQNISYSVTLPSGATTVPLPASGLLLLFGLVGATMFHRKLVLNSATEALPERI